MDAKLGRTPQPSVLQVRQGAYQHGRKVYNTTNVVVTFCCLELLEFRPIISSRGHWCDGFGVVFDILEQIAGCEMADTTISATGMRIVKLLVGNPSRTVADLMKAIGVTRTAVTEQLNELVGSGFVQRDLEHFPGRGRPRNRYQATDLALLVLFASNERLLGPAIWKAIDAVGGAELTHQILDHVSQTLAKHYIRDIDSDAPEERLRRMNDLLCGEGVLVEIKENDGQITLHKRSCPFFGLFEEMRNVCCMDEMIMTHVVGQPVKRISCRHDGAPCCVFTIDEAGA